MRKMFVLLIAFFALTWSTTSSALDPAKSLTQFKHTRWTVDDGAPINIRALAQTTDGYLWIGSDSGLYRFDGVKFEHIEVSGGESSIWSLLGAKDGSLWIGHASGRITVLQRGVERDVSLSVSRTPVIKFLQAPNGDVWVKLSTFYHQLAVFHQGKWTEYDERRGINGRSSRDIIMARDGTVLVMSAGKIRYLRPGARIFADSGTKFGIKGAVVAEDPRGGLWMSDLQDGTRKLAPLASSTPLLPMGSAIAGDAKDGDRQLLFDRDGNLWVTTTGSGIVRYTSGTLAASAAGQPAAVAPSDYFTASNGLSSDSTGSILQDREGTIWVGTTQGLDRFRATNVIAEERIPKSPQGYLLGSDHLGNVYAANFSEVYRFPPNGVPQKVLDKLINSETLCEDRDGTMWITSYDHTFRSTNGTFTQVPRIGDKGGYLDCIADSHGGLWFLRVANGLLHFDTGGTTRYPPPSGIKSRGPNIAIQDHQGRVVASLDTIALVRIDFPHIQKLWDISKEPRHRIFSLYQGANDLLIGTPGGLARLRDDRITDLGDRFPFLQTATGIVETPTGDTWVLAKMGLVRVRTKDLEQAFASPSAALPHEILNFRDGLMGSNTIGYARNSALRGGDGMLWFLTNEGIFHVDPTRLTRNSLPPPVSISALVYDGQRVRDPANLSIPKGTTALEIDYTALSLMIPERVQFRYRLEGFDDGWIDPGTRRQAFYTNLKPGHYRFQVIASNNDGVWNRTGATLDFTIPPTFLQSWWFVALCVVSALIFVWFFYKMRLRQIAARVRASMEVRLAERERIARELHDTLLQGVQGVIMRFQSVADKVPADDQVRGLMEGALDRADAMLVEGRERVLQLRAEEGEDDLAKVFSDAGARAGLDGAAEFRIQVEGIPRALLPLVREEAARVGDEAIANALHHAAATLVTVIVDYDPAALKVTVRDNGKGIVDGAEATAAQAGHFGLMGMRERARRINGGLDIGTAPGGGTEVRLTIPQAAAYLQLGDGQNAWQAVLKWLQRTWLKAR